MGLTDVLDGNVLEGVVRCGACAGAIPWERAESSDREIHIRLYTRRTDCHSVGHFPMFIVPTAYFASSRRHVVLFALGSLFPSLRLSGQAAAHLSRLSCWGLGKVVSI